MKTSQEVMAMQWEARGCEVWASPDTSEYICIASSELLADFIASAPALQASHKRLWDVVKLIDEILGDTNELRSMLNVLCPPFGPMCKAAIDQAPETTTCKATLTSPSR